MEDPKRIRTKIRLDLSDTRKQIEELEKELSKNKSPQLIEDHRKLIDYEKKLKDQYESLTGLSIDQAETLTGTKPQVKPKYSGFGRFLGFLGGIILGWGFYNMVLHGVVGFSPTDVYNTLMGNAVLAPSYIWIIDSMTYGNSIYFVIGPLVVGSLLVLLRGVFSKSRSKILSLLESIGYIGPTLFIFYIVYVPTSDVTIENTITDNLLYLAIAFGIGGFLVFISLFSHKGFLGKLVVILAGLLYIAVGAQIYMLSTNSNISTAILSAWPYIFITAAAATTLSGIAYLLGFNKN